MIEITHFYILFIYHTNIGIPNYSCILTFLYEEKSKSIIITFIYAKCFFDSDIYQINK